MWTKEKLVEFENSIVELYEEGKLPFLFHLSGGNEEQLINIFRDIKENDYVLSNHRSHYHALLHGISPADLTQMICDGRSMFVYDRERNFFSSAIIGGTPGIAVGIAWALKRKNSSQKVWCFVGDATEDSGHLSEAVRYVDGWDLPCTFIIESNNRSVEASNEDRWNKTADIKWSSPSVIKYHYEITYPHARKPGMVDLSKATIKSDEEYFPVVCYQDYDLGNAPSPSSGLSYKQAIAESMKMLAGKGAIFIGYNVVHGNAMGALEDVPDDQKLETPVAENLMTGLAIGMSFEGFFPVLYFERHDFMLVAADAIGNHMGAIERISHGQFKVPVIIRSVVADGGPFYSGPTHSQDFTNLFSELVNFPVIDPENAEEMVSAYDYAASVDHPVMIVDRKSRM